MDTDKPKIESHKRKPGRPPKGEKLTAYRVRIPAEILQKLGWMAAAQKTDVQDVIRGLLAHGTAGVKPPVALERREIGATLAQWERWRDLANALGTDDISAIMVPLMDRLYRKQFPG